MDLGCRCNSLRWKGRMTRMGTSNILYNHIFIILYVYIYIYSHLDNYLVLSNIFWYYLLSICICFYCSHMLPTISWSIWEWFPFRSPSKANGETPGGHAAATEDVAWLRAWQLQGPTIARCWRKELGKYFIHGAFGNGIFPSKPSSYWDTSMTMETTIWGFPSMGVPLKHPF